MTCLPRCWSPQLTSPGRLLATPVEAAFSAFRSGRYVFTGTLLTESVANWMSEWGAAARR